MIVFHPPSPLIRDGFTDAPPAGDGSAEVIPDVMRGLQTVVAAVIGPQGQLKDCNRGFLALIGSEAEASVLADVRALFVSPEFEILRRRPNDPFAGDAYRGPLSVNQGSGRTLTLSAVIFRYGSDLLLIAEHDFSSVNRWRATVLDLQSELSRQQLQIDALNSEASRLRAMLEAAMRDRDTLLDALAAPARNK